MAKAFGEPMEDFRETKFGIAMSGGGIRSAVINLGFLKTLNLFGILRKADYLSTVSGGGYTGAYVQATLKKDGDYKDLFHEDDINHMRKHGEYLIPGQTATTKLFSTVLLVVGYLFSLMMSLVSLAIVSTILLFGFWCIAALLETSGLQSSISTFYNSVVIKWVLPILLGTATVHFAANLYFNFRLKISRYFNIVEAVLGLFILSILSLMLIIGFDTVDAIDPFDSKLDDVYLYVGTIAFLILIGFVANPNSISFHRFYRTQLAEAFLKNTGDCQNIKVADLFNGNSKDQRDWMNPYPFINTCLNLQNPGGGEKFKGTKASDYFLLSPLFSGSKLTDYVKTKMFPGYTKMTLPAATTISAAAVNPGMGMYSSKMLSVLMTIFNARLGFWVNNPMKQHRESNYWVWWPSYFFYELFSKIGTANRKLNISDGGHIENLGVYELLRRKCKLILAVDAGADPDFGFSDLNNLTVRSQNELGIEISFREGHDPMDVIKPKSYSGYSKQRYAIADLYQIWEEFLLKNSKGQIQYDDQDEAIEVLVNYMPNGSTIDPEVIVKGSVTNRAKKTELKEMARSMVYAKLQQKSDLEGKAKLKIGTLVYIKSTVTPPTRKPYIPKKDKPKKVDKTIFQKTADYFVSFVKNPELVLEDVKYDTYKYKIYHPVFPHEPTSDQFFDPVQWEAYFQLGQFIGADVLQLPSDEFLKVREGDKASKSLQIQDLINLFEEGNTVPVPTKGTGIIEPIVVEVEKEIFVTDEEVPAEMQADDATVIEPMIKDDDTEDGGVGYRM